MSTLPLCCTPTDGATLAEQLYCAYNAAGDPATAGLNFRGDPCPVWAELPSNVREKWHAVARYVATGHHPALKLDPLSNQPLGEQKAAGPIIINNIGA